MNRMLSLCMLNVVRRGSEVTWGEEAAVDDVERVGVTECAGGVLRVGGRHQAPRLALWAVRKRQEGKGMPGVLFCYESYVRV